MARHWNIPIASSSVSLQRLSIFGVSPCRVTSIGQEPVWMECIVCSSVRVCGFYFFCVCTKHADLFLPKNVLLYRPTFANFLVLAEEGGKSAR